jgi:hypothetical protein
MKKSLAKIEAFKEQIESGKMHTNALKVYAYLRKNPCTIFTLRNELKISHQSLTSILSHLEDMGYVYKEGTIHIDQTCYSLYCADNSPIRVKERAESMARYKKFEWIKRGVKNGWITQEMATQLINEDENGR